MRWNRFWTLGLGTLFTCTFFIQAKNTPVSQKQDVSGNQGKPIRTIVIDAGHGGHDVGARGSYSTESQLTLQVALKLGKILEENMPDVKVVYTRKTDRFDDPRVKANMANDAKGELFVSIHCNSAGKIRRQTGSQTVYRKKGKKKVAVKVPTYAYYPNPAKGTETYIWATSKNNAKMESLKQNSVIVLDADSEESRALMDDTDPETFILLNTLRNAYFDQSLRLSTLIEDEFTKVGRISRGARQRNEKGIWVLSATAMPSVLVELGFISNPEEEDYLNSASGQSELANGIYKAIKRYRDELDRFTINRQQDTEGSAAVSSR
ncbi:N-acetylmuramoyl-L-alanine amidase [Chitinophaga sp. sic0106]|uniref:N-acetylmuramoyl-L-alanine amidase family protein n=1 Tax=Chitinophaga sp. sic0106 TaxID=2854785 RepID=UPI001C469455|nr:N-acetylmuramoyl-L-alanine amidase [Chitinophaga sp. sic0106]MBV7529389.1 N-acetylmuramoyl-L-alanine amidase [Chitinophaga sp. sic0106]